MIAQRLMPYKAKIKPIFLALLLYCMAPLDARQLPNLGNVHEKWLSSREDWLLGESFMHQLRQAELITQDLWVQHYLQQLGRRLSQALPKQDIRFKFFAVDLSSLNAFAFFGNHVAIHTGLITQVETEGELAAVVAHEMAHILQRHLARMVDISRQQLPITAAQIIAAIALSMQIPDAAPQAIGGVLAGHAQSMINFTREHEQEADRVGLQILADAHFDPYDMAEVFEHLKEYSRFNERPPEYLTTHPVYESRISDARNRASHFKYRQRANSLNFYLIRARIAALSAKNPQAFLNSLQQSAPQGGSEYELAQNYARALSLSRLQRFDEAAQQFTDLLQQHPHNAMLAGSQLENMMAAKQWPQALELSLTLYRNHPELDANVLNLARCLLKLKHADKAIKLLNVSRTYKKPQLLECLARAYSSAHREVQMHQTQAEKWLLYGEYKQAREQLQLALNLCDHENSSQVGIIQKRMHEVDHQEKLFKSL